jgi:hypothetical protein
VAHSDWYSTQEFMKAWPFAQLLSKDGGTPGFRWLCAMSRGVSSSPSNAGIPQAFDEAVGQREGVYLAVSHYL